MPWCELVVCDGDKGGEEDEEEEKDSEDGGEDGGRKVESPSLSLIGLGPARVVLIDIRQRPLHIYPRSRHYLALLTS